METGEIRSHLDPHPSCLSLFFRKIKLAVILIWWALVDVLVYTFLAPWCLIVFYSLPKKLQSKLEGIIQAKCQCLVVSQLRPDVSSVGTYDEARRRNILRGRIIQGSGAILPRACLVLLVWLLLNVSIPRLRKLTLLGSPLLKWSLLGVTITSSYFVATCLYLIPLFVISPIRSFWGRVDPITGYVFIAGYLYCGLKHSGFLVIHSSIVLVSWVVYFRTNSGLKHSSTPHPEAFEYVTWTCVSLFIGSILWLVKAFLLLKWSAGAIYRRFQPRILIAGVKFFFLGLIVDEFIERQTSGLLSVDKIPKIGPAKYIMSREVELGELVHVGGILTALAEIVSCGDDDDDGASDVIKWFDKHSDNALDQSVFSERGEIPMFNRIFETENTVRIEEMDGTYITPLENKLTHIVLQEVASDDLKESTCRRLTREELKKWMADGHKECVNMGRTLADAKAIVARLDIFLSFIILGATVLLWLLITGIATTTVLVTIATPLLALTFIFGDTAKAFFQGLIFCFATHAFDVGDRCLLDETELEVKRMSILTTTFIKIGTKEKILYPNSLLATKAIVNLGWQPDPSDVAEFTLDPSINIKKLKEEIVEYFGKNKSFYKGSHEVMFQEAGDKFTVLIYFTHILTVSDLTHSQCLKKKRKQRSEFVTEIKQYLINETRTTTTNDGNTTLASSTSPSVSAQHPISEISESNKHPELSK